MQSTKLGWLGALCCADCSRWISLGPAVTLKRCAGLSLLLLEPKRDAIGGVSINKQAVFEGPR
jgi:hypothetical protein